MSALPSAPARPSGLKLYDLADEYAAIEAAIVEANGELDDSLAARLDAIEAAFPEKVDACAAMIRQLVANGSAAKAEAERLGELAASRLKSADRLKGYLRDCLEKAGQTRVATDRFVVHVQKNSVDTVLFEGDPESLPVEFQRFAVSLDAAAVRAAHAEGRELPEGIEVVRGSHLRIR